MQDVSEAEVKCIPLPKGWTVKKGQFLQFYVKKNGTNVVEMLEHPIVEIASRNAKKIALGKEWKIENVMNKGTMQYFYHNRVKNISCWDHPELRICLSKALEKEGMLFESKAILEPNAILRKLTNHTQPSMRRPPQTEYPYSNIDSHRHPISREEIQRIAHEPTYREEYEMKKVTPSYSPVKAPIRKVPFHTRLKHWDLCLVFPVKTDDYDFLITIQKFISQLIFNGLETEQFYSVERTEIFCKVRCNLPQLAGESSEDIRREYRYFRTDIN